MKKRILALLLTLALVLPAVSCDVLLADPNAPVTPSDSQSESNNNTPDTERVPSKGPEVHTQPETPPDSEPPVEWPDEPQDSEQIDPPVDPEPETEYIPKEFKVTFVLEGYDNEYGVRFITEGHTVGKPKVSIDPAIGSFDGIWYTDPQFKQIFDFGTYITEDITLYGRFVPNPAAPALLITPEQLAEQASEVGGYAHGIASADVMTNGSNSFVRLTASNGDPYFMAAQNCGKMPDYLVIRYRTNSEIDGEMFIGSGAGPHGGGDHCNIEWNGDNEWHLAIIHLPSCGVSTIKNGVIDYLRMDFFMFFREGDYIDFAYIGFFNSPKYAEDYDYENYKAPAWKDVWSVVKHVSFDELFYDENRTGIFTPGQSAGWDRVAVLPDVSADALTYWGWMAYSGEFGRFGYQINGGTPVYDDTFTFPTEDGVIHAALGCGADGGSRMKITIPLAGLRGEYTVRTLYKSADGIEVCLDEFTVVIPTHYADYNVPQDQWVISGHRPQLQNSSDGMVAAGGVESAALLHQGSIYLGEIDLSKYSKVVIYWGSDNSQVTIDRYKENAHNRIMLLNQDMNMVMSPEEHTVIAGSTYTLHGWAVQAHVIDLTGIDYNGPVYVTYDTLPGNFMLISSVEFIGGEIVDDEPVIPEEPSFPEAGDATISFADHTYRVEEGEDYQIFANDGFVFTQYKGESTTWNTQRINPIRLYPQQVITFEYSNMDKLVVTVNNTTYVNKLISVISDDNTQVTVDGTNVTIQFITPVDYYELTLFAGQVRVDRVSVYAAEANDEFEPEAPVVENLVIDMATLGGAGFRADFAAAGYNAPLQLLGYAMAIDLGNIDLSKYSAVKITYGCDGSPSTEANFANASSLAIGLKSQNTSYGQETDDNFNGDIAHTDMVFSDIGWAAGAREAVVDLTNVNYNGNVWVAVHNPQATQIAISAIVFVYN